MWRWLFVLFLLSACGGLPLGLGGGTNVAANTQIGRENRQQVSLQENRVEAGRDVITETKTVEAKEVENVNVNNTNIPPWVLLLLLIGWLLPTPQSMGNQLYNGIKWMFDKSRNKRFKQGRV